ncbi:MAG: hypothetical protein P1V97_23820 [Planctomycetota bacterium]|nr:hypothetical protein [Planctomycetota bacterium]
MKKFISAGVLITTLLALYLPNGNAPNGKAPIKREEETAKEKSYLGMTSKEIIDKLGVPDYLAANSLSFTFSYGMKRELRIDFYGATHRCIAFQGTLPKGFKKTPRPDKHYYNGQTIDEFQRIYGNPGGPPEVISSVAIKLNYSNMKEVLVGHHQLVFVRKP